MSSDRFFCELTTRNFLRKGLMAGGIAAGLAGTLLIFLMPLSGGWRLVLCLLWVASSSLELRAQWDGMTRIDRIRIHSGGRVEGAGQDGAWQSLEVLSGSMVLGRCAWLRLCFADGRHYGEWLWRDGTRAGDWRRLQLVWRQRAALFGRSRVS
ncbi:MAG TPA: hypothetical protein VF389_01535 [Woeseiaceae bacterium]